MRQREPSRPGGFAVVEAVAFGPRFYPADLPQSELLDNCAEMSPIDRPATNEARQGLSRRRAWAQVGVIALLCGSTFRRHFGV